ncbi:Antibiotic biosynthesis monooxygenase [Pedobacter cryoconitis]|uniref:Antibiotic biosynthesis monooxygenase n=1 Tax=Pedobacter cryoconitis TaxID=188932 RepID=A0A127V9K3_9SPHI|nr:antibiotic biosynthesis monooxygenase [Pedobacter cryoconitis]AMP98026.1 Antibiotic biosynthesis monooxygenase [Pedobacter cryoconitis]
MNIYLTVIVKAKPEHQQEVKNLLYKLPELSKKEDACIGYDVHQSIEDKNIFILNEKWESLDGLSLHNEQSYSKEFFAIFHKLQENPISYRSK